MTGEQELFIAVNTVLGVQLAGPLLVGLPMLLRKDKPALPGRLRRKQQKKAPAAADEVKREPLVPLRCRACQAPVPLLAKSFPCPFCAANVEPPSDYVHALEGAARAVKELARAVRIWRWSRVLYSRPMLWLARLLIIVWDIGVLFSMAALSGDWPGMALLLAGILVILQSLVGLALLSGLNDLRASIPAVPQARLLKCPAEAATCRGCSGPVRFADDQLAVTCAYCEADNYRAALAQAARKESAATATVARTFLLEAIRAADKQREELLLLLGFMAFAELFYGVILGVVGVLDWIGF